MEWSSAASFACWLRHPARRTGSMGPGRLAPNTSCSRRSRKKSTTITRRKEANTSALLWRFIPTSRDKLIPGLLEGRGDIAAGILTVTPERLEQVDFGEPFFRGVKEIAVTGPNSPELASVDDLSGKEVFVRKSSSFWTHLEHLNERFANEQKPPVTLKAAPEDLQDDDLLEMVHAGLVGIVVVDRYQARLWATVFKKLKPHEARRGQQGRQHRLDDPQEQPETESGDCGVRQELWPEVGLREGPRQEIHRQPAGREDPRRRPARSRSTMRRSSSFANTEPSMIWTIC